MGQSVRREGRKQVEQLRKEPFDFYCQYLWDTPEDEKFLRSRLIYRISPC